MSHILNLPDPPEHFITAEHLLRQAKRPSHNVNLDAYHDDITKALAERRTTEKPKPTNKRILQQLNNEQLDKKSKFLTPSPRKHRKAKKYNQPTTPNVHQKGFALAARTIIHDAVAEIYLSLIHI